jgi:hypothetical protein
MAAKQKFFRKMDQILRQSQLTACRPSLTRAKPDFLSYAIPKFGSFHGNSLAWEVVELNLTTVQSVSDDLISNQLQIQTPPTGIVSGFGSVSKTEPPR